MHLLFYFFFFNDTATTEIYTLSLHDALPISAKQPESPALSKDSASHEHDREWQAKYGNPQIAAHEANGDRKSTRLNSSHGYISYAGFCLKKKQTSSAADT